MTRIFHKAVLANCIGGLALLVASGAHAADVESGDTSTSFDGVLEVGINTFGSYTVDDDFDPVRGALAIAVNPGSSGQVSVTGSGTTLSFNGDSLQLGVGAQGAAQMTIADGAVVDGITLGVLCLPDGSCVSSVGGSAGSNGSLTITGPGSQLLLLNALVIGNANVFTVATNGFDFGVPGGATTASVDIRNGAMLSTNHAFVALGPFSGINDDGANGTETVDAIVTVRGAGSEWVNETILTIATGQNTNGTLIVTNDGVVSTADLELGFDDTDVGFLRVQDGGLVGADRFRVAINSGSQGTILVSDAQITDSSEEGFNNWGIGIRGDAILNITAGGEVINDQGIDLSFAQYPGSSISIDLTGTGSLIDIVGAAGQGFIGFGWNLTDALPGGKCKVTLGKGTVIRADGIFVGPNCVIKGKGTLEGSLTNNGGIIAPTVTLVP